MNEQNVNEIYFIEAAGIDATRIGRIMISPNMPPTEFTEKQYKANQRVIEYYEKAGVITVTRPGTREAVMKAAEVQEEKEHMSEIFANSGSGGPPDPVLRKRGFSVPQGTDVEEEKAKKEKVQIPVFTAPSAQEAADELPDEFQCVVIAKGTGKRCKNNAIGELLVCTIHKAQLLKGKILKDGSGRRLSKDGKSLEA